MKRTTKAGGGDGFGGSRLALSLTVDIYVQIDYAFMHANDH
jgi:hypothetical protein